MTKSSSYSFFNKIYVETESGGAIYTLEKLDTSTRIVEIKRLLKILTGIPISKQELMIVGGDFRLLNDPAPLGSYKIGEETILKLYRVE
jgi:hypothetical protein